MRNLFTILVLICLITIEYLATTSLHIKPLENSWDKANHFMAFFVLYLLLKYSHLKLSNSMIALILLLFGIQIEIVQYFIPGREFSGLDILVDSLGIVIGILTFLTLKRLNAFNLK